MAKNNIIELHAFDREIGRLGYDENRGSSSFQYNPTFLKSGAMTNLFPYLIRRMENVQVFDKYNNDTFRELPPPIADSLPDMFGNLIFKTWMESTSKDFKQISVLEQLCYVGKRGMGALEYSPAKKIPEGTTINLEEIAEVVSRVLETKGNAAAEALDATSLINIFKIGSSAGGIRPKILVAQHKATGTIIPGDMTSSADYEHYLIKLGIDEQISYSREIIEYIYYLMAKEAHIRMMDSKLIDGKHFATLRYDRVEGNKKHVLTATGMTGWDFKDPRESSYENLFRLAESLKLEHRETEQLFRRMVFNIVFANQDDHLKNHAFIYNEVADRWNLAPAYDITYSLNPLINFTRTARVLSVNGKRNGITFSDIKTVAEQNTVRNAEGIVEDILRITPQWPSLAEKYGIPANVIAAVRNSFWRA